MEKTYLELAEAARLEEAAQYLRDKLLIRLLLHLGCRVSEALGIAVSDIDFHQHTITIQHLKVRTNLSCPACGTRLSKTAKFCPGCGAGIENIAAREREYRRQRALPVDNDTLEMLKNYIDHGGPVSSNGKQFLFGINRHRAWQIVRDCAKRAGMGDLINPETGRRRHISPHRLRDAFASHAVKLDDSGDGLRLLQEHLGHQNINTTMKYRKIAGGEHKEWYERLWEGSNAGAGSGINQR